MDTKTKNLLSGRSFVDGVARFHDLLYVISKDKKMLDNEIAHSSVIAVDMGKWVDCTNSNWNSTAIAVAKIPEEKMIMIGEDGEVVSYAGGTTVEEKPLPNISMIRGANTIDGQVYACGMKRQVFKREKESSWTAISAPLPGKKEKVGFEYIDGFSAEEIYCVGWNGEIWHYDGLNWSSYSDITNLILTSVCCADDGIVYAAGQQGTLIRGRKDQWELVVWPDEFNSDFWDVISFNNRIYLSTITSLYVLDGDNLTPVDIGIPGISSYFGLTKAENVLWSIGSENVLAFDGNNWIRHF